jgi:hypothetical protein
MDSYLSAEGILCEDIILSQDMNSFEDSVFAIHYMRQYSAARELEEFLVTYEVDVNNITDDNTNKFLHALQVEFYPLFLLSVSHAPSSSTHAHSVSSHPFPLSL